jgi:acetate kinase
VKVLVVNAGSSSLKLSLIGDGEVTLAEAELDASRAEVDGDALREPLTGALGQADAVGHRIVHGGSRFGAPVRVEAEVEEALRALTDLAPLHQPKSLAALDAVTALLPDLPRVACFDTAFHTTLPAAASTYALPSAWRERWDLRRYGFHGLSHGWVARQHAVGRVVSCHLGAGASLCAIRDGVSVDTTMGFTPLEGLVMATRSGSVDPGLVLWLLEHGELDADDLGGALEHDSGLLGLAGTADMREVLRQATGGRSARRARPGRLPAPAARWNRRDGGSPRRARHARVHRRRRRALHGDPRADDRRAGVPRRDRGADPRHDRARGS